MHHRDKVAVVGGEEAGYELGHYSVANHESPGSRRDFDLALLPCLSVNIPRIRGAGECIELQRKKKGSIFDKL